MKRYLTCLLMLAVLLPATSVLGQRSKSVPLAEPKADSAPITVQAVTEGDGVLVVWRLNVRTDAIGFNVDRQSSTGKERITSDLVAGPAMQNGAEASVGAEYAFFDAAGSAGSVYTVETKYVDGRLSTSASASAEVVSSIKELTGRDVALYKNSSRSQTAGELGEPSAILPFDLQEEVEKFASEPNWKAQQRVAAVAGVKFGIKKTGMYRVTRAQLQTAGFNVASDPTLWQLYVDGNEQAISVDPAGNFLDFYATSINTPECDVRMYYLSVGTAPGKRMETRVMRALTGTAVSKNYNQTYTKFERTQYTNKIFNGDAENWWGRSVSSTPVNYPFTLTGIDYNVAKVPVKITLFGFTTTPHSIQLQLNGTEIGFATGNGQAPVVFEEGVRTNLLVEGTNTLTMTSSGVSDSVMFDTISIEYPRRFLADQGSLAFYTENYKRATLQGFVTPDVRLFDVTRAGDPVEYTNLRVQPNGSTYDVALPGARGRVFHAVENASLLSPFVIETNNESSLRTPNHNANMVIITHKDYMAGAQNWATYRRGQGVQVEVVDVDDVYDEFAFGTKSWRPIRSFLQYAKANWQTPPGYVLLIGGSTANQKQYQNLVEGPAGYPDFIPTRIVTTVYTETGSDDSVADFNDDGLADIAIGRIPARLTVDVTNALNKTIAFETNPQQFSDGFLFVADSDPYYDFPAMSQRIKSNLPPTAPTTTVLKSDPGFQSTILSNINAGKYMVNYVGHGTIGQWSSGPVMFWNPNVQNLTNTTKPTAFTMLTCLNGYFLNLYAPSLAENLLVFKPSGSAASWASTGLTTPDVQEIMATRFYSKLGDGSIPRLGDLVLDAKSVVPAGSDVLLSWELFGDPMLKMR